MPTNWDTIPPLKIITAEDIASAVNDQKLVPNTGILTMGDPKKGMTKERMVGTVWYDTSSSATYYYPKTNKQLIARRDIVAFRPNIGLEARTISTGDYAALNNYDKANFSKNGYKVSQNSSGTLGTQASYYTVGTQFYYAFHFTNTGTLSTQGNVVFTLTIPNGLSCVLSGGQPTVLHLRGGSVITPTTAATLSGNTLTITITNTINPYDINSNPAAYHISVLMTSTLYAGWNIVGNQYAVPNIQGVATTAYAPNSPLSYDFYIKIPFTSPAITKTNSYPSTIPYNQLFDYTLVLTNASEIAATGIVVTDTLPNGLTFDSVVSKPTGWTVSVSGQLVTISSGSDSIPAKYASVYYTIVIRVRATTENINISNTATVCPNNGFCNSATKSNYIDYNRTPSLSSQGYYTCSSSVTYLVYRDTNINSSTYNYYYVNNISVGLTAPANNPCYYSAVATAAYQVTGYKNNCTNSCAPITTVTGSTVYLNYSGYPSYQTSGSYTSTISQADAIYQAQVIADNAFYAGLQAKYNLEGYCTWTATNVAGNYSQGFTKNNCGTDCYGNGSVNYSAPTQYASAVSTSSCTDAISSAATAAYNAAYAIVQANGQANANANGSCCCWTASPTCDGGCNYLGARQRNSCDGSYRNTGVTEYDSCSCNQNCKGTYYTDYYCDNRDKVYVQKYNCNGVATGNTSRANCGCDSGGKELESQGYYTCVGCTSFLVYKDLNRCSDTGGQYVVNGSGVGTTAPSDGYCNTISSYTLYRDVRCYDGTNYNVYENVNGCASGDRYQYRNLADEVAFTSNSFGSDPCTFYAYRSATFTRDNCGSGYNGGSVVYSNTYSYAGILNQSGADSKANTYFPSDGQNYANAAGSCTAIQVCKVYNIVAYDYGYYVNGYYTYCNGGTGYFSFYADSAGAIGQTPCVNQNSVVITDYGNGAGIQEAYGC